MDGSEMWLNLFTVIVANLFAQLIDNNNNVDLNDRQAESGSDRSVSEQRRFISLWPVWAIPIVQLRGDPCKPLLYPIKGRIGNCETKFECFKHKGHKAGVCAWGFGTCCTYERSCGAKIYRNNTYFVSRKYAFGFVPKGREVCSVKIVKTKRICQVRLDFLETKLEQGNVNGVCDVDNIEFLGVSGARGRIPPNLCGSLAVNSMYVHFEEKKVITMNVVTDGDKSQAERRWVIRMSFIPCRTEYTVPPDCTQYFTGAVGTVKILGFPQTPHLGDLAYSVCVRSEEGASGIEWSRCTGESVDQAFWFTGASFSDSAPNSPTGCLGDMVVIMSTFGDRPSDRYCGNALDATSVDPYHKIRSFDRPFMLRVKTDAIEGDVEKGNTGFCLQYSQVF